MKKSLTILFVALSMTATMTYSCVKEVAELEGQSQLEEIKTYATTIEANKQDITKGLYYDGEALMVKWNATDQVSVYPESWSVTTTLTPLGSLNAAASGDGSTTLSGNLTGVINENDHLHLLFPRASWDYTGQKGVLLIEDDADNSIEKKFDYALADVTVYEVTEETITTSSTAEFESQQAIVKFILKNRVGNAPISATNLTISASGGKLVQSRSMHATNSAAGWEDVSGLTGHFAYLELNQDLPIRGVRGRDEWSNDIYFVSDDTYGTDGCKEVAGKYVYRFVSDNYYPPQSIVQVYAVTSSYEEIVVYNGDIPFTNGIYLRQNGSSVETVTPVEGAPEMTSNYGSLTIVPEGATSEFTVALRNELGSADTYQLVASDGDHDYTCVSPSVDFQNGGYYEVSLKMDQTTVVDLSTKVADYEAKDGETLTNKMQKGLAVSIEHNATVTLMNANITLYNGSEKSGITCLGDATLVLKGVNKVYGGGGRSAVRPGEYCTLTIEGKGTLIADGGAYGSYSAGIGFGNQHSYNAYGSIQINSGTIVATGSVGIGAYYQTSCGTITITGGHVTATGNSGPGIGASGEARCGDITISGGTVIATGGDNGPGIGYCGDGYHYTGYCGNIEITSDVTLLKAKRGRFSPMTIGKDNDIYNNCGTITIAGVEYYNGSDYENSGENYILRKTVIYPMPAAATGHAVASAVIGDIIGTDGVAYNASDSEILPLGVFPAAMVAYLGNESDCTNGLAIAMEDESNAARENWSTSISTAAAHTPADLCGGTWRLPSLLDWQYMFVGCGATGTPSAGSGAITDHRGINTYLIAADGVELYNFHWTSTEADDTSKAWYFDFDFNTVAVCPKTDTRVIRSVLAY